MTDRSDVRKVHVSHEIIWDAKNGTHWLAPVKTTVVLSKEAFYWLRCMGSYPLEKFVAERGEESPRRALAEIEGVEDE